MILHWLTTGWRSLIANPLFSAITIISLSIGCCGALLVGANIRQHLSFDRWVPDAEHVFTVTRLQDMSAMMGPGMRMVGAAANWPNLSAPVKMADIVKDRVPGVEAAARMLRGPSLLPPDPSIPTTPPQPGEPPRTPPPGSVYVDPSFFEMFGLEFVEGSAEGLSEPMQIVITQTAAKRVFGDSPALGQTVEGAAKRQYRVVGVIRDLPDATTFRFEALSSLRTYETNNVSDQRARGDGFSNAPSFDNWNNGVSGALFIRTSAAVNPKSFAASAKTEIQAIQDERSKETSVMTGPGGISRPMMQVKYTYNVVPLLALHLGGRELSAANSSGDMTMLVTLATAALALLVVSAFNYVTLSLARSLRRRREVAVRKVLGAGQSTLVRHYITESALVTAISLAIGFALAQILHPWFARTIGQPETLFDLFDPAFLAGSLIVFALLALAVGAYPAFYLAQTRPRTALGEGGTASPGRISQMVTGGLIGLQISAATGLAIVALTMTAQANYIENRSLGFETKDRYQVQAPCSITPQMNPQDASNMMRLCQGGVRQMLARMPDISKPAYANSPIVWGDGMIMSMQPFGKSAAGEKLGEAMQMSVDTDFLETMGAKLLAGRLFDSASAYDRAAIEYTAAMRARQVMTVQADQSGRTMMMSTMNSSGPPLVRPARVPVVITRAMLLALGVDTPEEAIGMQISVQPQAQFPFEIVGVVEDWNQRPLKYAAHPMIFVPSLANNAIIAMPRDAVEGVQGRLNQSWRDITGNPNATVTLRPLQQTLEQSYQADFQLMRAVTSFALVAIVVAGMGVFGLSAFEMRRRVREIGIRKALGAGPFAVAALAIGRALLFAGIAALIAWPIGFYVANQWLSGFVYRTSLSWLVLPVASLAVVGFVGLAVAYNAFRAAAIRPGLALRV